jgi:serine/threonine protein kinase
MVLLSSLSGGKLLGQGTYGCVFHPSINCSTSSTIHKKGVSKIFKSKASMQDELKETTKVEKFDKKGTFTNKALTSCDVDVKDVDKNDMKGCKFYNEINIPNGKLHQIVYEHKGIDLKMFMRKQSYEISETFEHILNLLKGIQILVKHKYLHLDLKPDNMLITDSNKALLIDFGLGRPFDLLYDLDESDYVLAYSYHWYAPEFKLFYDLTETNSASLNNKIFDGHFKKYKKMFVNETYEKYGNDELFDKYSIKEATQSLLSKLVNDMENKDVDINRLSEYFTKNFAHKADIFAIGVVMYKLLQHSDTYQNDEGVVEDFMEIIYKATHINPFERYTIEELITDFKKRMMPNRTSILTIDDDTKSSNYVTAPMPNSTYAKTKDCLKHKMPELRKMVDTYKLPKSFKSLKKVDLCKKMRHIIHDDYKSNNTILYECMKQKKSALVKKMKDMNLPVKYKQLKKEDICQNILENNQPPNDKKSSNEYYLHDTVKKDLVSEKDCKMYYTLKELKEFVDKKELPLRWKRLNKETLCKTIHTFLPSKTIKKEVKRGRNKNSTN